MVEFSQDLSVQDLRVIIHGLKMAGFSSLDEDASDQIKSRIKNLPPPESLTQISENPIALKGLVKEVGEIMRMVEIYGKRDPEYRARFKSKKGLPPRYKVLEWRPNMKTEKSQFIKNLVKLSSDADSKGHIVVATQLLKYANKVAEDKFEDRDVEDITIALRENGLEKEAQFWSGVKELAKGVGNAVKEKAKDTYQAGAEMFQVGKYKKSLQNIMTQLGEISGNVSKAASGAKNNDRKTQLQDISNQVANMLKIAQEVNFKIEKIEIQESGAPAPAGAPTAETPATTPAPAGAPTAETPATTPAPTSAPTAETAPATVAPTATTTTTATTPTTPAARRAEDLQLDKLSDEELAKVMGLLNSERSKRGKRGKPSATPAPAPTASAPAPTTPAAVAKASSKNWIRIV